MKKFIATTSILALLISCGGSDGGNDENADTATSGMVRSAAGLTSVALASEAGEISTKNSNLTYLSGGADDLASGASNFQTSDEVTLDGEAVENGMIGVLYTTNEKYTAISAYADDEGANASADYNSPADYYSDNATEAQGRVVFSDIEYLYLVAETGNGVTTTHNNDGTMIFNYNMGTFKGALGEVKVEGTVDGNNLEGDARLTGMKGTSTGVQVYEEDFDAGTISVYTDGAFAGDDDDSAFSGMWQGNYLAQ